MCTITTKAPQAMVCDVALPLVTNVLASDPQLSVRFEPTPDEGTRITLTDGDLAAFEARIRAAVAEANR